MEIAASNQTNELALETIVNYAIQIPGVKVDRQKFLAERFAKEPVDIPAVIEVGPVQAGCSRELLTRMANKLILARTSTSSAASFAMGLPGGIAMGATIPADTVQFFGMSLRLAQELSYLYGAQDLWKDGEVDDDAIRGQLILYCGVMFGVSGAAAGVRVLSSQIAKTTLKKLPQQALTKTLWFPVVKQVGKLVGVKVTKNTVAKGVSKAIPIVGGVVSGGLNFASMLPMAKRLAAALDKANFDYTEAEALSDYREVQGLAEETRPSDKATGSWKMAMGKFFSKGKKTAPVALQTEDSIDKIQRLARLREQGAITQEEFETKKAELLARI